MTTPDIFDLVYDFNDKAGLIEAGYDDFRESAFQVEEAIENFSLESVRTKLENSHPYYSQCPSYEPATAKDVARALLLHCTKPVDGSTYSITDVDRLDKACDAIIFAIGSMAKLGLSPEQMRQALDIVAKANLAKLSMPKDEYGKLTKNPDFIGPEKELQKLLDER